MESIEKRPPRKIGIIAVWMGDLPSYFPVWLRTLETNSAFDFFLFTDQPVETVKPNNLKVVTMSFTELKSLIAEKLFFQVNIPHAYKFTDFKPAYGEIFYDYLAGYDFWGYCDMDVLFGDLKKYITDDILLSFKKVFSRGHLTLYKNETLINAAYRSGSLDAKKILQSPDNYSFDEWFGIHRIFEALGIPQYNKEIMGDIRVLSTRLECSNTRNYRPQIFVWEEGTVRQYYIEEGQLKMTELAYIHFQKRKISLPDQDVSRSRTIILNPHALLPFSEPITAATVREYDRPGYNHYFHSQFKRIRKRLVPFIKDPSAIVKILPEK
jgi:hypothetical protein